MCISSIIESKSNISFHTNININNNIGAITINCIVDIDCDSDIVFRYNETSLIEAWQVVVVANIGYGHIVKTFFNNFNRDSTFAVCQVDSVVGSVHIHNNITNSINRNGHVNDDLTVNNAISSVNFN